jgi:hypothetical protein
MTYSINPKVESIYGSQSPSLASLKKLKKGKHAIEYNN